MTVDLRLTYVCPISSPSADELPELAAYLTELACAVQVVVLDGSPEPSFTVNKLAFGGRVTHVAPDPRHTYLNGKVSGVETGIRLARHEHVVIADDDVRYTVDQLARVGDLLERADLVRPQNVFDPLPWHAQWDTARSLLNRAIGSRDYPGTFGVLRSTFVSMGGYDGDVMFENLELERTVRAAGGREECPLDLFVVRRPCTTRHFFSQRVRQAYDDLAQPWRLVGALAFWPGVLVTARRRPAALLPATAALIGIAEAGRRRAGGQAVYGRTAALWAPAWVAERGTCAWAALFQRFVLGGVSYRGRRIRTAAHSMRTLRARAATYEPLMSAGSVR